MEIKQKQRSEIPAQYKWDLTHLFPSDEVWRETADALESKIEELSDFEGQLTTGENILACLNKYWELYGEVDRLCSYAELRQAEDSNDTAAQAMVDKGDGIDGDFEEAAAFINPEILELSESAVMGFIENTKGLEVYRHYLSNILRNKPHTLSVELEEMLASVEELGNMPYNTFQLLDNADLNFGSITDENGNLVEVTHSNYSNFLRVPDRRVRKDAFMAYYGAYMKLKNTYAALRSGSIKKDVFFAKARNHNSSLEASLSENNIPLEVYNSLIETANEFVHIKHRYTALIKKVLGLETLHRYDRRVPLVPQADHKIPYDEASKIILEALAPLGEEYIADLKMAMNSGWIDVYANEGKTSGGFEASITGAHSYILMNYEDKFTCMATLAHEWGHALHTYYASKHQHVADSDPCIFLAEVASNVNEILLTQHMLKNATDPLVRKHILVQFIDQLIDNMLDQTGFAEFEKITHALVEDDESLTHEELGRIHLEIEGKYYGPDMVQDEEIGIEWAGVPHFYDAFYCYQYATGFAAALSFVTRIQSGDANALNDYLGFLKAGNSDYPIEILKKAGVDMTSPTPVREAMKVMEALMGELEEAFA